MLAQKNPSSLTVLLSGLDYAKTLSETWGHAFADDVLKLATLLKNYVNDREELCEPSGFEIS